MASAAAAAVLCGLLAALLGSATAASAHALSTRCPGDQSGPVYSVAGRSTRLYVVEVGGVSCAFAAQWVGRLAAQSRLGALHGPAGWSCVAASRTTSRLAVFGGCRQGKFSPRSLPAKFFDWYPDLPAH